VLFRSMVVGKDREEGGIMGKGKILYRTSHESGISTHGSHIFYSCKSMTHAV
jgi:hypothetical protein